MTQTLQSLVSRMVSAWTLVGSPSDSHDRIGEHVTPAPNTEAEAAAWLMRQERNRRVN